MLATAPIIVAELTKKASVGGSGWMTAVSVPPRFAPISVIGVVSVVAQALPVNTNGVAAPATSAPAPLSSLRRFRSATAAPSGSSRNRSVEVEVEVGCGLRLKVTINFPCIE